jgi:hypothetical protein
MADLTDEELKELQDALNRFEPEDVHQALDDMAEPRLHGAASTETASGPLDFGSIESGVQIYRLDPGRVRIRITMAEISGGSYDDVEVADANVETWVQSLVATLERRDVSEAP